MRLFSDSTGSESKPLLIEERVSVPSQLFSISKVIICAIALGWLAGIATNRKTHEMNLSLSVGIGIGLLAAGIGFKYAPCMQGWKLDLCPQDEAESKGAVRYV